VAEDQAYNGTDIKLGRRFKAMNDMRIKNYVDDIFRNVAPSNNVTEQKEELVVNITERVQDYVREGLSFDVAFDTAKNVIGDTEELTAPFKKTDPQRPHAEYIAPKDEPARDERRSGWRIKVKFGWGLVAMAPFLYVLVGMLQNYIGYYIPFWGYFGLNWWAWGWIIIPGSAILCSPIKWTHKFVSLSPFIYLLLGFWFGMWAFGWVVIPLAACMEAGVIKVTRE
jgi:hypothetical protein